MASCYNAKCYHYSGTSLYCDYYEQYNTSEPARSFMLGYEDAYRCRGYSRDSYGGEASGSDGCFLTSACVSHMGKSDDCEELTTLRAFRDGYMRGTSEGAELIKEYYAIAPQIVQKIDASEQKHCTYCYIYSVVQKCVGLIKQNKNEETMNEYKNMVLTLKKQFA